MPKKYSETTLSSGLRVIHERSVSSVVYCGYIVKRATKTLPIQEWPISSNI